MRSLEKAVTRLANNIERGNYNLTPLQMEIASQRVDRIKSRSGYIGLRSWIEEKSDSNTIFSLYEKDKYIH